VTGHSNLISLSFFSLRSWLLAESSTHAGVVHGLLPIAGAVARAGRGENLPLRAGSLAELPTGRVLLQAAAARERAPVVQPAASSCPAANTSAAACACTRGPRRAPAQRPMEVRRRAGACAGHVVRVRARPRRAPPRRPTRGAVRVCA
jgi:hypothetical protein